MSDEQSTAFQEAIRAPICLPHHDATHVQVHMMRKGLKLPRYATKGSAGADICAADAHVLLPGECALVSTGLQIVLAEGTEGQIRSRSGMALRHGVVVMNSPGTIDCDYRGEVKVLLENRGKETFHVLEGMHIAQLVVAPVLHIHWDKHKKPFEQPSGTKHRRLGGFGSTGV